MQRKTFAKLFLVSIVAGLLSACSGETAIQDNNTSDENTTDTVTEKNGPVHASDFALTLDVNETTIVVNWKEQSSAFSEDNGTFSAVIKTQGQYGNLALDGDNLFYIREQTGKLTDQATLQITEGNSTAEITVSITSKYWKQIAAGRHYTMAVKSDGTLWGWGSNNYGQLGDGTTEDRREESERGAWSIYSIQTSLIPQTSFNPRHGRRVTAVCVGGQWRCVHVYVCVCVSVCVCRCSAVVREVLCCGRDL